MATYGNTPLDTSKHQKWCDAMQMVDGSCTCREIGALKEDNGNLLTYEVVTPVDLIAGNVILSHCGIFRVVTHKDVDGVGVNICEFVRDAVRDDYCVIPKSWRDGWNEQGNRLARTCRILSGL